MKRIILLLPIAAMLTLLLPVSCRNRQSSEGSASGPDPVTVQKIPAMMNMRDWFETAVSPYKGKTVIVYLWNPRDMMCVDILNSCERFKKEPYKTDDIVWMDLAPASSAQEGYSEIISNLSGLHYCIEYGKFAELVTLFEEKPHMPLILVVDPDGKCSCRSDLIMSSSIQQFVSELIRN